MVMDFAFLSALAEASTELPGALAWSLVLADGNGAIEATDGLTAAVGSLLRKTIEYQSRLSTAIDRLLPQRYRIYGRQFFREQLVPRYLARGQTIYDVGGGANPFLTPEVKDRLGARVVGLDVSAAELERAPERSYDCTRCVDISAYQGSADADIIICQSVLEHVRDVAAAFRSLSSILRPGGRLLVFVPNRNALFARLNLLLPEQVKRGLLFTVYPEKRQTSGFPAYYDRCTPREFRELATRCGLIVEVEEHFFISSYFFAILPAYFLWRLWILTASRLFGGQAASTFCMVLRKPHA